MTREMARYRPQKPRNAKAQSGQPGSGNDLIYGIHAVEAALGNPNRAIQRISVTENAGRRLAKAIAARGVPAEFVKPKDLDRLAGSDARHQGVVLEASQLPKATIDDLARARLVVVLDQVSDPHNVGAVLRSSAAFGVDALIMTARNSPPLSATLAKVASGGLEHVKVLRVTNLARTLGELANMGFDRIGLDGESEEFFENVEISLPFALVLGAEGKGLRRLTAENCDRLCKLRTDGPISSLNVSNAAAIALHSLRAS